MALQWGRDHVIAELMELMTRLGVPKMLQWGRDHVIAELGTASVLSGDTGRFNGAAIT